MSIKERLIAKINTLSNNEMRELLELVDEQRKTTRKPYIMEVQYQVDDVDYRDFLLDISLGGIFIETRNAFPIGQKVLFRFELTDIMSPFLVDGYVVWQGRHGLGIQFADISAQQIEVIEKLVASI